MRRLEVFTLIFTLAIFLLAGCDNGSVSSSSIEKSSSLVKVSLTVGGDASKAVQKSAAIDGSYWTSFTYQYNAVPQWSGNHIHGAAGWTPINYSEGMSLGYFSPGQWVFGIRILDGSTVVYEGYSAVTDVTNSSVAITVFVSKLASEGSSGTVLISVSAPTVQSESLSISYTGTASGGPYNAASTSSGGTTSFEHRVTGLAAGSYTFTLTHGPDSVSADVPVTLSQNTMAVISGRLVNGVLDLDCINVPVHSITINVHNWGTEQNPEYCGSVFTNTVSAAAGERVSFSVQPIEDSGLYEPVSVTCGGNPVEHSIDGRLYTFIMPDGDVTVNVKFLQVDTSINPTIFSYYVNYFYSANSGVLAFGQSDTPPAGGESVTVKDVVLWYDSNNNKICWYSDKGTVNFKAGSLAGLFKDCSTYTSISMDNMDTSLITSMASMFQSCTALTQLDVSDLDTTNCTDMSYMFADCGLDNFIPTTNNTSDSTHTNYIALNLSSFNTAKVTNMDHMFYRCNTNTELQVLNWDVSKVTNMSYLFGGDYIKSGNLHYFTHIRFPVDGNGVAVFDWDTSSCTSFKNMFNFCNKITKLDISSFDFSNITDMGRMFDCCTTVSSIEFPPRTDLTKVETMVNLFTHCRGLNLAAITGIVAKFYIDDNVNPIFKDLTDEDNESPNRILAGSMEILTGNTDGARRKLSTYGHTNNVYLGGKKKNNNEADVENESDYQRLVLIPKKYKTAAYNISGTNWYNYIDFYEQYNSYYLFEGKADTIGRTYIKDGSGTYTGNPAEDGDIVVTGKWRKDDDSGYENVTGKTVTISGGKFTIGTKDYELQ